MPDPSQGFASGLLSGMQGAQGLELGKEEMQLNELKISQTKLELKKQQMYIDRMAKLNSMRTGSGAAPSPQDQAREMSTFFHDKAMLNADIYPEQAEKDARVSGQLAVNAATIDMHEATTAREQAGYVANITQKILDADASGDIEGAHRMWGEMNMFFPAMFGKPSQYANQPYSKELVTQLHARTTTAVDEANIKMKGIQEENIKSQEKRREIQNKLTIAQTKAANTRREFLEKNGGKSKITGKQQDQADALADAISDIDNMMTQLKANPDMNMTGWAGRAHMVGESVSGAWESVTGAPSSDKPEHDFRQSILALKAKIGRAMTGVSRSGKDERELTAALVDMFEAGTTGDIGARKLGKVKEILQRQLAISGVKPRGEQSVLSLDEYLRTVEGEPAAGTEEEE